MSDNSLISWTDATWNVATGCTRVSAGCDHCYIERTMPFRVAHRRFDGDGPGSTTGVLLHPERLDMPLHWRRPRLVFVNSLADLFHDDIPDDFIARVFAVMAAAPQHTFQVLTKRHARMRSLLRSNDFASAVAFELPFAATQDRTWWPLPNVWVGVSVENQQWADVRIPALLDTPAAVRWLSCEPLLGPIEFRPAWLTVQEAVDGLAPALDGTGAPWPHAIDWVVAGGESGPGARPMHPDWARSLRDQCQAAGVAFHFKQWGEWRPYQEGDLASGRSGHLWDGPTGDDRLASMVRPGKKAAGRELDGRTWDEYPRDREAVPA